ncbi:MAG: hypothetical protein MJZ92_00380 [Paludibacteraceae bacterium]|nr:hypothetical protein [Paludibacteraceae bacterium]
MKTRLLLLCALMGVLVACDKNANEPQQVAFRKGQKVTLRVDASLNQDAQSPRRVSGTIASDGALDFAWEEGDKIQVIVGDNSTTFTMRSFDGASAEFTGAMPADGVSFDVTYTPANAPTAEQIKQQTAASFEEVQTIDKKYFSLEAKNCQLGNNISLRWIYSAVKVTLQCGDENSINVQGIRIMPKSPDGQAFAFILTFDPVLTIDEGVDKSLYIIVNDFDKHSSMNWNIEVKDSESDWNAKDLLANKEFENFKQFQQGYIYQLPILTLPEGPSDWD